MHAFNYAYTHTHTQVNSMLTESLREAKALLGQVIAEITRAAQEAKETETELVSEHRRSVSKEAALALQLQLAREQDEEKFQTLESKKEELDFKSREVENLVAEKFKQQQDLRSAHQPTSPYIQTHMPIHTHVRMLTVSRTIPLSHSRPHSLTLPRSHVHMHERRFDNQCRVWDM